jgi:hypothetical protein
VPGPTIHERFPTAVTSTPPTDEQRAHITNLHARFIELGDYIEHTVPDGRDKSLALTHLEDALMRANRAIYAHRPPAGVPKPTAPARPIPGRDAVGPVVTPERVEAEMTDPANEPVATAKRLVGGTFDHGCCLTGTCSPLSSTCGLSMHVSPPIDDPVGRGVARHVAASVQRERPFDPGIRA